MVTILTSCDNVLKLIHLFDINDMEVDITEALRCQEVQKDSHVTNVRNDFESTELKVFKI